MMRNNGYSLVELMVSAVVMVVIIVGVVSLVRTGRKLQVEDRHRRNARAIVQRRLEMAYDYRDFNTILQGINTFTDTLDMREGNPLLAVRRERVVDDTPTVSGTPIPRKRITVEVAWTEPDGTKDTIQVSKWLSD